MKGFGILGMEALWTSVQLRRVIIHYLNAVMVSTLQAVAVQVIQQALGNV